ncbi:MAG: DUF2628 domain-containing protein [Pseudorhodoplanes sp.]|nr:DUF2628 domain-containing protein [Pseudorhodoplanes sp.]
MAVYTVHEPPAARGAPVPSDRAVFVRDGFYFWAFLLGPIWMLWRRLWLVLLVYLGIMAGLHAAFWYLDVREVVQFLIDTAIALLIGLEASTLQRWTLARRGWAETASVVGDDLDAAERRYFASRFARTQKENEPGRPGPMTTWGPTRSASDVVGLFPEPGGPR